MTIVDRSTLCIDWDERSLRVIEAVFSRSGVRIRRAIHVPLAAGVNARDPAAMGDFLNRALREHRIRAKKVIIDVPRQDVILNLISLPRGSRDELTAMVHAQVSKELPFSKDQAAIDFAVTPDAQGTTCQVWVAAVRSHVIDYYQQTLEAAGLTPERIGLRSYATLAAVVEGGEVAGRTVLVDVGPSMTEISVIRDARLVYSRAASVTMTAEPVLSEEPRPAPGDQAIPLADDFLPKQGPLDALLIEVSRTLQAYRASDAGARIDRIILSGTGGVDERLRAAFETRFGNPTRLFEAPAGLNWKRVAEVPAPPFIAAIGQTYNHVAPEIERFDFLHPKEPEAERKERAKRRPVAALTVALFLAAAVVLMMQVLRIKEREVDEIRQARAQVEQEIKDYDSLQKKYADVSSEWMQKNVVWLDKMRLLADHFVSNQEAYITELDIRDTGEMVITLAETNTGVAPRLAAEFRSIPATRPAAATKPSTTTKPAASSKPATATPEFMFITEIGTYKKNEKDPKYPFIDSITVRVKALEDLKKSKTSKRPPP
jgi:type IV pilus assembly protein PilM